MPRCGTGSINSYLIPYQNTTYTDEFYYNNAPAANSAVSILTQLQYLRYASASTNEPLELTTVDGLSTIAACPLDLSINKNHHQNNPITPPTTPSPDLITTSVTPIKRKRSESPENLSNKWPTNNNNELTPKESGTVAITPSKKIKTNGTVIPTANPSNVAPLKKPKAVRKLNFDEDKSSPVSGTIIRELGPDETLVVRKGDIDPAYNVVEVTDEAKAELAKIENHIGEYVCRLCKELYEDAFQLAQHRCSRIVHVEYRCPECDKVFNCPANLASHRRWHKPRNPSASNNNNNNNVNKDSNGAAAGDDNSSVQFPCLECGKKFRRQAYLRKHLTMHNFNMNESLSSAADDKEHHHHPSEFTEMKLEVN